MGALAQLNAQALTFSAESPLGRWITSELTRKVDPAVPTNGAATTAVHSLATSTMSSGGMTLKFGYRQADGTVEEFTTATIAFNAVSGVAVDAVHVIGTDTGDHSGGDFKITVTFASGEFFETAALAFDITAAELETAIDVAATAKPITGWVNGYISASASGVDLQDGTLTLTFDGATVDEIPSHPLTVISDESRTGGTSGALTNGTVCIQADIDRAAAAASITGFAPGDIVVTGVDVDNGPLTFTYGDQLQHATPVLANVDGTGGAWGATSVTTPGQTERAALAVLLAYGVLISSVADQDAANDNGTGYSAGVVNQTRVPAHIVKSLMAEAAAEDNNNATYHAIEEALFGAGNDRADSVEPRVPSDE